MLYDQLEHELRSKTQDNEDLRSHLTKVLQSQVPKKTISPEPEERRSVTRDKYSHGTDKSGRCDDEEKMMKMLNSIGMMIMCQYEQQRRQYVLIMYKRYCHVSVS